MSPTPDLSHQSLLSESLKRLQLKEQIPSSLVEPNVRQSGPDDAESSSSASATVKVNEPREGYGFRPTSGSATPVLSAPVTSVLTADGTSSPLPDPNGLGWPGKRLSADLIGL